MALTNVFQADNIQNTSNVISPIFFCNLFSLWAPILLTAGALTDPQLPARASNVYTTDARLGVIDRVASTGWHRPGGIGRVASTGWHRPGGIDRVASTGWHRPGGIGRVASIGWHRPGGIGRVSSAGYHRPGVIGRVASAGWHRSGGIGRVSAGCRATPVPLLNSG